MISGLDSTPKALRVHIGVFGDTNAGKSTFINAVTGQDIALTSPVAGTTTDPVFKPMELLPIGPVVFIDTAGLDDKSELGDIRVKKTREQLEQCNCAVVVVNGKNGSRENAMEYIKLLTGKKIPFMAVINQQSGEKSDISLEGCPAVYADLHSKSDVEKVKEALIKLLETGEKDPPLTADLVKSGDTVLLVMPQDIQAPKGRLILPQVQTIRDLLDNKCSVISVTTENLELMLSQLKVMPALVITDSQVFGYVSSVIPEKVRLTSFSVIMAKMKGDIDGFIKGAAAIDSLSEGDRVLILESCAHHALEDDIARVKIPALLKKYTGKNLIIDNLSGQNISFEPSDYKLAIHCGGCMVSRKAMISKQRIFEQSGLPLTNFGIAIAYMNGILKRVVY
ncbi:MAG: [FeFe] hydrogenase H-cluster maturation GTPase HydF [Porcipelethomonas sp.]